MCVCVCVCVCMCADEGGATEIYFLCPMKLLMSVPVRSLGAFHGTCVEFRGL